MDLVTIGRVLEKIEESDKNIKLYIAGLNEPSKKVSNKVDMPETPEVLRIVGTAKSSYNRTCAGSLRNEILHLQIIILQSFVDP